jgi:tetratricopeptide (TPR) repeat protein
LLLLLLEAVLRLFGYGHATTFFLRKTVNGEDLWIQNDHFAERFLGREMARQPFPLAFPRARPSNTIRIFVFGESAAFGDPQSEFGLPRMLQVLLEPIGKKQEAEPHFREALKDRINTAGSYKALGQLCYEKGWLADAAKNFTDALRLDPSDATTHVNLGLTLGMLNRQADARAHYAEAVRLDPNLAEAHARLGLELGRRGDDAAAVAQFSEAVRLKPDYLEARLNLGIALSKQQRMTEAREQFQEILRRNPTNAVARKYVMSLEEK